jgi:hypothetical protein
LAGLVPAKAGLTLPKLIEAARMNRAGYEQNEKRASEPLDAPQRTGGISLQRGTIPYVVESWSPWLQCDQDVKLADYPVGVYVPKAYDGKKPYGLVVSMTNAKSSSRYPRDFAPTLDRHELIWVGFDPYNGLYAGLLGNRNPAFCLAIVYVEGDYDYNRRDADNGYDDLFWAGYPAVYCFHEPMKGHVLISADSFERVIGLIDAAKRR